MKESSATPINEEVYTGKRRRNKIPDISLKRKKAKTNSSDAEYRSKSSPQHHEKTELSHETSPLAPGLSVEGFNELMKDTAPTSIMPGEEFECSSFRKKLDSPSHTNIDANSSVSHSTIYEHELEDSTSLSTKPPRMPRLPEFLRNRFLNATSLFTQSPTYEFPNFEDVFKEV